MVGFKRTFPWVTLRRSKDAIERPTSHEPLREFVYLDEVSLASLLASQKGELTENITAQSERALIAEASGKFGTNIPLTPTAEASSRFQTTNSNALQTVRKANAQSLFREFHNLKNLRLIEPMEMTGGASSIDDVFIDPLKGSVYKASDLKRGNLVEFRVKLSASWIFQISTMVAEFSEMFDESPALFIENVRFSDLYQAKNANNIITKLLAGLVPIDGLVVDYSVLNYLGDEYIVHNKAFSGLAVDSKPLQIVGVTDHLAYWKDIRRILFADNEFTLLCRLSKSGIQDEWNPIKVADIFREFAPDLAKQIEVSSRVAMVRSAEGHTEGHVESTATQLMLALVRYKDITLSSLPESISESQSQEIDKFLFDMRFDANTAEGQRAAFGQVNAIIKNVAKQEIDAAIDLTSREAVRGLFNLPLFPSISEGKSDNPPTEPIIIASNQSRLLDVEVVAIYW